jgi:hypothetical protein
VGKNVRGWGERELKTDFLGDEQIRYRNGNSLGMEKKTFFFH